MTKLQTYLNTLRRIPADVFVAVAGRDMEMNEPNACLVGWVVREALAKALNQPAEDVKAFTRDDGFRSPYAKAMNLYGGESEEWFAIYGGVTYSDSLPDIEEAFVIRLNEAVAELSLVPA